MRYTGVKTSLRADLDILRLLSRNLLADTCEATVVGPVQAACLVERADRPGFIFSFLHSPLTVQYAVTVTVMLAATRYHELQCPPPVLMCRRWFMGLP